MLALNLNIIFFIQNLLHINLLNNQKKKKKLKAVKVEPLIVSYSNFLIRLNLMYDNQKPAHLNKLLDFEQSKQTSSSAPSHTRTHTDGHTQIRLTHRPIHTYSQITFTFVNHSRLRCASFSCFRIAAKFGRIRSALVASKVRAVVVIVVVATAAFILIIRSASAAKPAQQADKQN